MNKNAKAIAMLRLNEIINVLDVNCYKKQEQATEKEIRIFNMIQDLVREINK